MIFSSVVDYTNGLLIEKNFTNRKRKQIFMIASIIINVLLLGFFKYSDFIIININNIFNLSIPLLKLGLPIGISFFTFQTMSYSIDVYRGTVKAEHKFINFMTYVSMFPQLIAGPIVRYEEVGVQLHKRDINFNSFSSGLIRFTHGLFKKVLIANNVGYLWSVISTTPANEISFLTAWIGIIAFTFQIYFDFSGYSDMAIGMGRMLGFSYPENFNYPYVASSITDFWRRWHISLFTWFKDYVYIPLGGSRVRKIIIIRNLMIVWLLTGIWHGAAWNFILWGLYYGFILILEKFIFQNFIKKWPLYFKHIYSLFFIITGWLIFAFDDINSLANYASVMFGLSGTKFIDGSSVYFIINNITILTVAIIFSLPTYPYILSLFKKSKIKKYNYFILGILLIIYLFLLLVTISYLVSDTYNPFLYFRF
jgi:alginate O-acetyltransferase complex protein AlgI